MKRGTGRDFPEPAIGIMGGNAAGAPGLSGWVGAMPPDRIGSDGDRGMAIAFQARIPD